MSHKSKSLLFKYSDSKMDQSHHCLLFSANKGNKNAANTSET